MLGRPRADPGTDFWAIEAVWGRNLTKLVGGIPVFRFL